MKLSGGRILLIGDVMLDRYVHSDCSRISPEAPIPILEVGSVHTRLGGAGTVLRNLVSLGASVTLETVIGDDASGISLLRCVEMIPETVPNIVIERGRRTSVKTRYIVSHHHVARADYETRQAISDKTAENLLSHVERDIDGCDAVIISDYGKGVVTPDICEMVIKYARHLGKPVVVDPKNKDFGIYSGATVITPNLRELEMGCDRAVTDIVECARSVMHSDNMLVTCGKDGMVLVTPASHKKIPSFAREVFDVTGAGDAVVAVLALALAANISLEEAAYMSNVAAGIVVGKIGSAVVTREELGAAMKELA